MSDNSIQRTDMKSDSLSTHAMLELREKLSVEYPDIEIDYAHATTMPLVQIAALGAAFSAIPETFRTVTQSVTIPAAGNLFSATTRDGRAVTASELFSFKDLSGLMGSYSDGSGLHQIRLHEVSSQAGQITTALPIDPATMFMAAALMEINRKLDSIQETQEEMFEYLKNRDKAELRAGLEALSDILDNYQFNWNIEIYKKTKYAQVLAIRQSSEKSIIHLRAQAESALKDNDLVHFQWGAEDKMGKIIDILKEYQLALHTYSFATFLEIMLLENFDEGYLESVACALEEHANRYRKLYTHCYNTIENLSRSSVDNAILGGIAEAGKALGGFFASTPFGNLTPIDEALSDAGKGLEQAKEDATKNLMARLHDVKATDAHVFVDNIREVSRIYNHQMFLLADEENLYLVPAA